MVVVTGLCHKPGIHRRKPRSPGSRQSVVIAGSSPGPAEGIPAQFKSKKLLIRQVRKPNILLILIANTSNNL